MPYCERSGPGLLDEPVNAATNVAFFAAALAAWWLGRKRGLLAADVWLLILLSISIGVGSTLWHTVASPWSQPLDVIPILLFQLCFLWQYCRRHVDLPRHVIAVLLAVYVAGALLGRAHRTWLNGLPIYAPAMLAISLLGIYHWWTRRHERFVLLGAAGAFHLALVFRSIDLWICPRWPLGTHFLWHVFNGVVVYLAMRSVLVPNSREPIA